MRHRDTRHALVLLATPLLLQAACGDRPVPAAASDAGGKLDVLPCSPAQLRCITGGEHTVCFCPDAAVSTPPPPRDTWKCSPGERMWCDGPQYDGWGQVECDPATGKWKAKTLGGKQVVDCQEDLPQGKVPDTLCACYHAFFTPACCERPDCVVPAPGTGGRTCPKSAGGLCDYCDPMTPACAEAGALCLVTNAHETFCGRPCSSSSGCPTGYTCMTVKLKTGTTQQCVPSDYSCYH